ncbi:MAG: hypothetical protein ACR2NI_14740 [Pirellulales bacterium]
MSDSNSQFMRFEVRINGKIVSRHVTRAEGRAEVNRLRAEGHPAELAWHC